MKVTAVSGDTVVMLALGAGLGLAAWMVWNRTAGRAIDAAASAYESASQAVEKVTTAAATAVDNIPDAGTTAGYAALGPIGVIYGVLGPMWDKVTRQPSGASGGW